MSIHGVPPGVASPPPPPSEVEPEEHGRLGWAPGTMILVFVFLACFALYYFTNWKLLSFVWRVG